MSDAVNSKAPRRSVGLILATFAGVGPLIGALTMAAGIFIAAGANHFWITLLAGYVFGLIPALLVGGIVAYRGGKVHPVRGAIVGGAVSLVVGLVIFAALGNITRAGLFAVLGACAGFICTWLTRRWQ